MQIFFSKCISIFFLIVVLAIINFHAFADRGNTGANENNPISNGENILPPPIDTPTDTPTDTSTEPNFENESKDLDENNTDQNTSTEKNPIENYFDKINIQLIDAKNKLESNTYEYLIEQIRIHIKADLDLKKIPGGDIGDASLASESDQFLKLIKTAIDDAESSLDADSFQELKLKIINQIDTSRVNEIVSEELITAEPAPELKPSVPLTEDEVTKDLPSEEQLPYESSNNLIYIFFAVVFTLLAIIISILLFQLRNKKNITVSYEDYKNDIQYRPIKVTQKNKVFDKAIDDKSTASAKNIEKSFRPHNYGEIPLLKKITDKNKTSLTIYTEKNANKGEDANPVLSQINENDFMIAVFDGLGGAGGSNITSPKGEINTHAYYGSRILRDCIVQLSNAQNKEVITDKDQLKKYVISFINDDLTNFRQKDVAMLSKKPTKLPTTFALTFINQFREELKLDIMWAGDSRCFAMSPGQSLTTLTKDDTKDSESDSLNLKVDSPMINYVNAEGNFYINQNKIKLTGKNILIVATDGCFGYFPSPVHFEYSLLKTLSESTSIDTWQKKLTQDIVYITKDDATMSLLAFGWDNFLEIKDDFESDFISLKDNFIKPFETEEKRIEDLKQNLQDSENKLKEVIKQKTEEFLKK